MNIRHECTGKGNKFRIVELDGEQYFVLKDITSLIGIQNNTRTRFKNPDEFKKVYFDGANHVIVTGKGLYDLMFNSRKKDMKHFKETIANTGPITDHTQAMISYLKFGVYVDGAEADPDSIEARLKQKYLDLFKLKYAYWSGRVKWLKSQKKRCKAAGDVEGFDQINRKLREAEVNKFEVGKSVRLIQQRLKGK